MGNKQQSGANISGRDAALARRQALSRNGKAGTAVAKAAAVKAVVPPPPSATPPLFQTNEPVCTEMPCLVSSRVNGRDYALARRQAMARKGKLALTPTSNRVSAQQKKPASALRREAQEKARRQAAAAVQAAPVSSTAGPSEPRSAAATPAPALFASSAVAEPRLLSGADDGARSAPAPIAMPQGRARAAARRASLSTRGKTATGTRSTGEKRTATALRNERRLAEVRHAAAAEKSCECGCRKEAAFVQAVLAAPAPKPATTVNEAPAPVAPPTAGRAYAMARRAALTTRGKKGAAAVRAASSLVSAGLLRGETWNEAVAKGLSGRQLAMAHRVRQATVGRSKASSGRPSAHLRDAVAKGEAPAKVEESETLGGRIVTGTSVERRVKVTGNEAGSTRTVTGTEYVGAGQFESFGKYRPAPGPDKVRLTQTSRDLRISGTEVGRSLKLTGDEPGACRAVTGTEYMPADRFQSICGTKPEPGPEKISVFKSRGNQTITGNPVGRSDKVTGNEPGSARVITGTGYVNVQDEQVIPGQAPAKVALTHTIREQPVSGTVVGRSERVTGDEAGSCRPVSGTEYISNEQFQSVCRTSPYEPPAKVGRTATSGGQSLTGTLVGRSVAVTGDEAGSAREISGDQYFAVGEFGRLATAEYPRKVMVSPTGQANAVTGTLVGRSGQVTGDEPGTCKAVTGTEYVSPEQYKAFCETVPPAPAPKVGTSRTWEKQTVTGSIVGRSARVTGNEYGTCESVTGTPYFGTEVSEAYCPPEVQRALQARAPFRGGTPGHVMTGIQPGIAGGMTGAEAGACQVLTGSPYVGADQYAAACTPADGDAGLHPRFRNDNDTARASRALPVERPVSEPGSFSIMTPAREARSRITGTAYGGGSRITGPTNRAPSLVSGTPEFRYRPDTARTAPPAQAAPAEDAQPAPTEAGVVRERITGEGREAGSRITGDAWDRNRRVTGTEGSSAASRNPTQRGTPRGLPAGARPNREMDHPEPPTSRITGSAGATSRGPLVTLSGGARG